MEVLLHAFLALALSPILIRPQPIWTLQTIATFPSHCTN